MDRLVNGVKMVQDFSLTLKVIPIVGTKFMIRRLVAQRPSIRMVQLLLGVRMVRVGTKTLLVIEHRLVSTKRRDVASQPIHLGIDLDGVRMEVTGLKMKLVLAPKPSSMKLLDAEL